MSEAALKALCRETKALIIVSEFEARRMPMFQLRSVLSAIITSEEERKQIVDLIERDLRATGYPPEQITSFLDELLHVLPAVPRPGDLMDAVQGTRRLRSPFSMGFEAAPPPVPGGAASVPALSGTELEKTVARGPLLSVFKSAPVAEASDPPFTPPPLNPAGPFTGTAAPPVAPAPKPSASTPTPATGARRSTFVFDASMRPPSSTPAGGTPLPPGASSAVGPSAPPGTKSWRQELVFGKAAPGAQATGAASRQVVMIADDDKRIRMVFRLRVEEAGLAVVECENGTDAWERVQRGDIALAVLDMKMPGLHGLEVLSNMLDKQVNIPVIICSAYDQLQDEFVVKSHPKLRYLVKPVAPEALVAAIRELLAMK